MSGDDEAMTDEQLEAVIRAALDDELIDNVIGLAMTGWDLRDPDAALAALTFDSAEAGVVAAGVRSQGDTSTARVFEGSGVTIDVQELDGVVTGQVVPVPRSASVEALDGTRPLPVDEHGRFSLSPQHRGPLRLRIDLDGTSAIVTEWFQAGA